VEGNRVSLALDGISLPDAAPKPDGTTLNGFGIGRDYFDPETFRDVRIGSGSSPAGAGTPGLGGSVSFVTKAPEDYLDGKRKLYADYKFGYTSDHAARVHAVTAATEINPALKALVVAVHRDGEQADSKSNAPLNPDDWNSDAVLAKLHWTIARGQQLNFTIDSYKAEHTRAYNNKTSTLYPTGRKTRTPSAPASASTTSGRRPASRCSIRWTPSSTRKSRSGGPDPRRLRHRRPEVRPRHQHRLLQRQQRPVAGRHQAARRGQPAELRPAVRTAGKPPSVDRGPHRWSPPARTSTPASTAWPTWTPTNSRPMCAANSASRWAAIKPR
jgi:outer membrane receptor protein involved in Fe transport